MRGCSSVRFVRGVESVVWVGVERRLWWRHWRRRGWGQPWTPLVPVHPGNAPGKTPHLLPPTFPSCSSCSACPLRPSPPHSNFQTLCPPRGLLGWSRSGQVAASKRNCILTLSSFLEYLYLLIIYLSVCEYWSWERGRRSFSEELSHHVFLSQHPSALRWKQLRWTDFCFISIAPIVPDRDSPFPFHPNGGTPYPSSFLLALLPWWKWDDDVRKVELGQDETLRPLLFSISTLSMQMPFQQCSKWWSYD